MRKYRLWILSLTCVMALALGYLARPKDRLEPLRRLRPVSERVTAATWVIEHQNSAIVGMFQEPPGHNYEFAFTGSPRIVLDALEREFGQPLVPDWNGDVNIFLPSGDHLSVAQPFKGPIPDDYRDITCYVEYYELDRPWYVRTLQSLERRLGISN